MIDIANNSLLSTPGLDSDFSNPQGIAITPDGQYAYVTNSSNSSVSVISIATNSLLLTPGLDFVFSRPQGIAITPDGNYAYVTNAGSFFSPDTSVSVIDTNPSSSTYNTIIDTIFGFEGPYDIAITSDGQYAYVTNFYSNNGTSVGVIDIATNSLLLTPGLDSGFSAPQGIAITPNDQYAYVANSVNNSVSVIYTGAGARAGSPIAAQAVRGKNVFLSQIDNYVSLSWWPPTTGENPVAYKIYRDAALTQLVATVPANGALQYIDHNRNPRLSYTYYIVSVDASGLASAPAVVTVV